VVAFLCRYVLYNTFMHVPMGLVRTLVNRRLDLDEGDEEEVRRVQAKSGSLCFVSGNPHNCQSRKVLCMRGTCKAA
jgi:hypothetical protein